MTHMDIVTTRWWLIRHAPPINPDHRIYGQSDIPVDTGDAASYAGLAAALPEGAVWVVTHLLRTQETAAAIHRARGGLPPARHVERDLAEQHFGEWQGLTHDALNAGRPAEAHRFWLAPATERPPGGESFTQVVTRVGAVLDRLSERHAGRDVVAVAHGGPIRAALTVALRIDAEAALRFRIDTLSLTRLDHLRLPDGTAVWRVAGVNLPPGTVLPPL